MTLQFTLIRSASLAVVDNADITVDLSALPTNVEIIAFQGIEGKVEYNDRPELRTPFTDPSPYQPQINLWMTAYAAAAPVLLLSQAKQVKKDLVDSIFHHKRRLPYTYGPWQYDARDEAVAYGTMLLNGTTVVTGAITAPIDTVLNALRDQVNAYVVGSHNSNRSNFGTSVYNCLALGQVVRAENFLAFNPATPDINYMYHGVIGYGTLNPDFNISDMSAMTSLPGTAMSANTIPLGYVGNITMQPLNSSVTQTIPADSLYQALLGISQRRNLLNSDRFTKQIAIENLTTIAAVAAYDATTGWSS